MTDETQAPSADTELWPLPVLIDLSRRIAEGSEFEELVSFLAEHNPDVDLPLVELAVANQIAAHWQDVRLQLAIEARTQNFAWSDIADVTGFPSNVSAARHFQRRGRIISGYTPESQANVHIKNLIHYAQTPKMWTSRALINECVKEGIQRYGNAKR